MQKKSKLKLYIFFIYFLKAYDKVKRPKLIELLKSVGCGKVMLEMIKAINKSTTHNDQVFLKLYHD